MTHKNSTFVPLTKLIGTLVFSIGAIVLTNPYHLCLLCLIEVFLLALVGHCKKEAKVLLSFAIFALILGLIQYAMTHALVPSLETALRMLAISLIFLLLLVTTPLQALTVALVKQCKIPYEYAFMFTAALRFIPDFIQESQRVQEAQMCRGLRADGALIDRIKAYGSIVHPLVLRSLKRSETMALSLELRGFGNAHRTFSTNVSLQKKDYYTIFVLAIILVSLFLGKGLFHVL